MLARTFAIVSILILGGCALSDFLPDWTSPGVAGPEPAYKFLIANKLKEVLGDESPTDVLAISKAERIESLKGASWRVCVKAMKASQPPRYYAVLFQNGRIVDAHLSFVIDQCELQSYSTFDWKMEANNPPSVR
jgi:hypothetical protein